MLIEVLVALAVIVVTACLVGGLFERFHQPAVMGEVVAGIILGPSLLGRVAPELAAVLLPTATMPFLGVLAQLGVILYMFLTGLELDLKELRSRATTTMAIATSSIVVPFGMGLILAKTLYGQLAPVGIGFTPFALFLGVAVSITAFPVMARILGDQGLQRTPLGIVALTCAAINDVAAWCLLAVVVGVTQATFSAAIQTIVLTVAYIALTLTAGKELMVVLVNRVGATTSVGERSLALVLVAVLLSAAATELIGIHAMFGAFLLGAMIPHESVIATYVTRRLDGIVRVMFLPVFLAFMGLRTQIGLVQTTNDWLLCGVFIAVGTIGKSGGAAVGAMLAGLHWRDSAALGILMNTRGLVELIVLNIGLDLGVISPRLFSMLVIMAIATTLMTAPILRALLHRRPWS
jgi:Kef-type K+ transport system membrane component KefB